MKSWYVSARLALRLVVLLACSIALWPAMPAHAQGVTTGAITLVLTSDWAMERGPLARLLSRSASNSRNLPQCFTA